MKSIIKSAKTIEEAIELGTKELGLTRDQIDFEIIEEPTKGLFGIFGGNDAIVKVKEKEEIKINLDDIFADTFDMGSSRESVTFSSDDDFDNEDDDFDSKMDQIDEMVDDFEDEDSDDEFEDYQEETSEIVEEVEDSEEDVEEFEENIHTEEAEEESETEVEENQEDDFYDQEAEEVESDDSDFYEETAEDEEYEADEEETDEEFFEDENAEVFTSDYENTANTRDLTFNGLSQVVEDADDLPTVAEKVKKNLEDILVKMHIEAKVSYETQANNTINLVLSDISENDTCIIIGSKGETLNAVQYLLSLITNRNTKQFYRVTLDVADYRDRRRKSIEQNAQKVAYKVLKTKKSIALKAMNSYERRIVHYALQNYKQIETVSSGKFPNRKVVVKYKG